MEQTGNNTLQAYELEEYYNATKFDHDEVMTFKELLNTGSTSNLSIRPDWSIRFEQSILPVKERIMRCELVNEDAEAV